MQQMQGPEGRSYNEGYPESSGDAAYQDEEQGRWSQSQYGSQEKLQPKGEAKLSTINFVLAILGVVTSSLIMGLSIALFGLITELFGRAIGGSAVTGNIVGVVIASFVISLVLLIVSVAGFVFSTIQLAIMGKKRKQARGMARLRSRY